MQWHHQRTQALPISVLRGSHLMRLVPPASGITFLHRLTDRKGFPWWTNQGSDSNETGRGSRWLKYSQQCLPHHPRLPLFTSGNHLSLQSPCLVSFQWCHELIWNSLIFWLFLPQGIRSGYSKIKNKIHWALQRLHYKLGGNEKMGLNR